MNISWLLPRILPFPGYFHPSGAAEFQEISNGNRQAGNSLQQVFQQVVEPGQWIQRGRHIIVSHTINSEQNFKNEPIFISSEQSWECLESFQKAWEESFKTSTGQPIAKLTNVSFPWFLLLFMHTLCEHLLNIKCHPQNTSHIE